VPKTTHPKGTPNTQIDTARPDGVSGTETCRKIYFLEPKTIYSKLATQKCKVCKVGNSFGAPKSQKGETKAAAPSAENDPTSETHNSLKKNRNDEIFFFNIKYSKLAFQPYIKLHKQSSFGASNRRYKNVSLFCTLNVSCYKTKTIKKHSIGGSEGLGGWGTMVLDGIGIMTPTLGRGAWYDRTSKKKNFFFHHASRLGGPSGTRVLASMAFVAG
jgi:hypothetical protein